MKEAPRFDDGTPLKEKPELNYCDKGGHFLRSVFNKSLEKAKQHHLPLEKVDLEIGKTVTIYQRKSS